MAGQSSHRTLFPEESLPVLGVEIGGEHLDRNRPVQGRPAAAIHDPEPTPPDFLDLLEPRRLELSEQ